MKGRRGYTLDCMNNFGPIVCTAVVLLAGCVNPETACRDGLPPLKARLDAVVGYTEHPEINELMAQARAQYSQARSELNGGQYENCLVSLTQVEIFLDKAKRARLEFAK